MKFTNPENQKTFENGAAVLRAIQAEIDRVGREAFEVSAEASDEESFQVETVKTMMMHSIALAQQLCVNAVLAERVDALEARLEAMEKT